MAESKPGGYWRGDKWIPITWGDKIGATHRSKEFQKKYEKELQCETCGKTYHNHRPGSRYCSRECSPRVYRNLKGLDRLAARMGATLLMGKGKRDWILEQLAEYLGTECRYCGDRLTKENISIDHIEPYRDSEKRKGKTENKEIRRQMDRRENLQFICRECNFNKGIMSDEQFGRFMEFLRSDPDMMDLVLTRFRQSRTIWVRKRAGQAR